MADILIRGVPMPVPDFHTTVTIMGNGDVLWFNEKVGTAIPLPEGHGDLVERKELNLFPDYKDVRNRIKQTIKATERDGRTTTGVTIDLLKQTLVALDSLHSVCDAKTIVPAEGDKIE